ncbi:hypothetical protein RE0346_22920 [Prescottella equi]|nr:hypothetical protein RE0346_22920 [Prescottella equi]
MILTADHPSAAVDLEQHRRVRGNVPTVVDVDPEASATRRVRQVAHPDHVVTPHPERQRQLSPRHPDGRHRFARGGPVVGTERRGERSLDLHTGAPPGRDHGRQARGGQSGRREPHHVGLGAHPATRHVDRGIDDGSREQLRSKLCGEPAGEKGGHRQRHAGNRTKRIRRESGGCNLPQQEPVTDAHKPHSTMTFVTTHT